MRALTVAQPWASLIMAGVKTIETRPAPPNGTMRPDGVRGLPGRVIEPGERIAIHAAAQIAKGFFPIRHVDNVLLPNPTTLRETWRLPGGHEIPRNQIPQPVPKGAVIGTVVVAAAMPILGPDAGRKYDGRHRIWCFLDREGPERLIRTNEHGGPPRSIADQLPLGDFTPGRWAWLLDDPEPFNDPVPVRGRQGVWEWEPTRG